MHDANDATAASVYTRQLYTALGVGRSSTIDRTPMIADDQVLIPMDGFWSNSFLWGRKKRGVNQARVWKQDRSNRFWFDDPHGVNVMHEGEKSN